MAKLIYSALASLDGYIADAGGNFDWAAPNDEVHAFLNDRLRDARTYLLGRRTYTVLIDWEGTPTNGKDPVADFSRLWHAARKIVYSRTLESVATAKTTLVGEFEPPAIAEMKSSSEHDITIGGPGLAAHALRAGLVDELQLYVVPFVVGGGTRWLPDDLRLTLSLQDERRFDSGIVYLNYRPS